MRRSIAILLLDIPLLLLSMTAGAQQFSVSTNLAGWADFGTANLEAGTAVARHISLHAGFRYNPWTFRPTTSEADQLQNRKRAFNAGIRWWPWHIYSGWWLGARGQWMEYNRGGIFSRSTEEGEAVGAGLSAGYTRMLHRNWNIEFGLGVWGGTTRYTTYACPTCGTVTDGGKKAFILPDDLMVSLIYIF